MTAHHGSLARRHRLDAEQRLKAGQLKALVATASLELGIDIGDVDLVCQLGSPTRHRDLPAARRALGPRRRRPCPRGGCFRSRATILSNARRCWTRVRRGELDAIAMPPAPLDVLAQQIVAEVPAREWDEDALFALFAAPRRTGISTRAEFDAVVHMLADGYTTRRGRRGAYLHRDGVHGRLRRAARRAR